MPNTFVKYQYIGISGRKWGKWPFLIKGEEVVALKDCDVEIKLKNDTTNWKKVKEVAE